MPLKEDCPLTQFCHQTERLTHIEAEQVVRLALAVIEQNWHREHDALTSPELVRNYLKLKLGPEKQEMFCCLFLDSKRRVITYEPLFRGTISSASVHPRVVAQKALEYNAAAMIVAHNHPSGVTEPSMADRSITEVLHNALSLLDVRLLDHFIVGEGEPYSMAEMGDIDFA